MKLPGTIDRLRRGAGDDEGWEYVEVDADDVAADDGDWEYVLVDEEPGDATSSAGEVTATGDRPRRGRRGAGLGLRRLGRRRAAVDADPLDDGDGDVDDDVDADLDLDADPWVDELGPDDAFDDDGGVDPRIAARRDSVALARRARLRRRLIAAAVVVAIIAGLGALTRSAALDVDTIRVTGAEQSDPGALATASGISAGTPLVGLDLEAATAALEREPWVLDAAVERTWSGDIAISVVERRPVATVNAGAGGWLLIDGDRRIVASSATPPDLPIVDGVGAGSVGDELDPSAQAALDVAGALTPGLRTRVAVVDGTDPSSVELVLTPTGTVHFGPATNLDQRMRSLQTVFAQVDLLCLATVDLQVPDAAVLTRVPACA